MKIKNLPHAISQAAHSPLLAKTQQKLTQAFSPANLARLGIRGATQFVQWHAALQSGLSRPDVQAALTLVTQNWAFSKEQEEILKSLPPEQAATLRLQKALEAGEEKALLTAKLDPQRVNQAISTVVHHPAFNTAEQSLLAVLPPDLAQQLEQVRSAHQDLPSLATPIAATQDATPVPTVEQAQASSTVQAARASTLGWQES